MESFPSFYSSFKVLLDEIPNGKKTTTKLLALALGDPIAEFAVKQTLRKDGFSQYSYKIEQKSKTKNLNYFSNFQGDRLLQNLSKLQEVDKKRIITKSILAKHELVAGVDVSYKGDNAHAVCVVMNRDFEIVDSSNILLEVKFPYIPGYLAFREAPAIIAAMKKIHEFDVLMVNGHGIAHPRGCGLASYIGLKLKTPTIGIAKRPLTGIIFENGKSITPLTIDNVIVGVRLRKKAGNNIFISVGHNIDLSNCIKIVNRNWQQGVLPEPLLTAHNNSKSGLKRLATK
jgi:deoxyribonuclease V